MKQIHFILAGKVQGVMLREHIRKNASILKIEGWVKNRKDETVEIVAQGREIDLKKFEDICKKGTFLSQVKELKREEQEIEEEFDSFQIRHF